MAYTWQEVLMGIDARDEAKREQKEMEAIQSKQLKEQEMSGLWSLGLSLLGGALFGPVGYVAGKKAGEWGADYHYDWETMRVSPGKFRGDETEEFNRTIAEAASDQDKGQILSAVMDLATMYVQAGGLQEGFDPTIGKKGDFLGDWGTFGTGDSAWSLFGKEGDPFTGSTWASEGAGGMIHPVTGEATGSAPMPTGTPGIPGLFSSDKPGFMNILQAAGERIGGTPTTSPIDELMKEG